MTAGTPAAPAATARGNAVDRAFARRLVPHHEQAVAVAQLAVGRAEHRALRALAADVVQVRRRDLRRVRPVARHLGVRPGRTERVDQLAVLDDADTMALSIDVLGTDAAALSHADPFDRAVLDAMIAHDRCAIRMARVELARGMNPQLRAVARWIVRGQAAEVARMCAWNEAWYGG